MSGVDICLLCQEPPTSENIEVRRLAESLRLKGHEVRLEVASSRRGVSAAIERAILCEPSVLHFNIRYPDNYLMDLAFADMARRRGYRGRITCSGSSAALNASWVLEKIPAVDAVIPYSADHVLHLLLKSLRAGTPLDEPPGLITRGGGTYTPAGPVEPNWRPLRGNLPQILGVRTASLASVDGCAAGCAYCVHAAIDARIKSDRRHMKSEGARECHPGRRPLADLVEEMAELYHDRGVRYFAFTDDNPLPASEKAALAWLSEFRALLDRNRVRKISLGMNTRGDRLTPPVTDALVRLGLVRTLMGVESSNAEGLRSIGRAGDASAGTRSLQRLASVGVLVWFNSIFLRPDSDFDSIRRELRFLDTVPDALFNTVKLRPFSGTSLEKRLAASGRLTGSPDFRDYVLSDPRLAVFNRNLYRFQFEAARSYDPALRLHDLLLSATLADRHRKTRNSGTMRQRLRDSIADVNRTRIETLEQLLDAAQNNLDADEILKNAVSEFARLHSRLDNFAQQLEQQGTGRVSTHYGHVAAAAALLFALSVPVGCASVADTENTETDSAPETESDSSTETESDSESDPGTDNWTDTDRDTDPDTDTDTVSDTGTDTNCNPESLAEIAHSDCGQKAGNTGLIMTVDGAGQVTGITYCDSNDPVEPEVLDCMMNLLKDERFPCLADQDIGFCVLAIE